MISDASRRGNWRFAGCLWLAIAAWSLGTVRVVAMIAIVLVGLACIPGRTVTSSHTIASYTGRLVGGPATGPDSSFDCTWLEDATGHRVVVIYPPGWDERFNPTRILDASGAVYAVEGDLVRVTYVAEGIGASACSPGMPIAAETVERVEDPTPRRSRD